MADQGRDEAERKLVTETREAIENAIDWDCEVIKITLLRIEVYTAILLLELNGFLKEKSGLFSLKTIIYQKKHFFLFVKNY